MSEATARGPTPGHPQEEPARDPAHRDDARVGWIGTGRMGSALAVRLVRAGYDVAVHNRTRAKAAALGEAGATVVDSITDLAGRGIVFVIVASDAAFASVAAEVLAAGPPGILVDCSTVSAEVSAQVRADAARVGAALVSAPLSGNPGAVAAGHATLVGSGPADAFRRAEPVLEVLGRAVTYVGDGQVARLVKLCHNVFLGVVIPALEEITVLANKAGVSRTSFLDFLNSSVLGSTFTGYKAHALTELDFTPTFTTRLLRKDLDLGLAAARHLEVPMPLAAAAHHVIQG